jgi:GT2 family glycosyltransferase
VTASPVLEASVVVPSRGVRDRLERLLESLATQSVAPDRFEVVVVLNPATEEALALLQAFSDRLRIVIVSRTPRGRAAACNAGLAAASGDVVVFLDEDMAPRPAWLGAHLDRHAGTPRAVVMGAVPVELRDEPRAIERWVARRFREHHERVSDAGHAFHLRDFYTGNTSIARDVLEEIGGFDEQFTQYGHEDLELLVRLGQTEARVVFEPRAVAVQTYDKSFGEFAQDMRGVGRTAVQLAAKHPDAAADLVEFRGGHRLWVGPRRLLLWLHRRSLPVVPGILATEALLERWVPTRLTMFYVLATDYFFWLGVQDEGGFDCMLRGRTAQR